MKLGRLAVALVAVAALSGCLDLLEEIWVNPDGSARMVKEVVIPKMVLQIAGQGAVNQLRENAKQVEATLKKDPEVTKYTFRDYQDSAGQHLAYELEVKHAQKLGEIDRKAMAEAAPKQTGMGEGLGLQLRPKRFGGGYEFIQTLSKGTPGLDGGEAQENDFGQQLAQTLLSGHYVTVRVHAPTIGDTNGLVNAEKNTVEWKIPLADLASNTPRVPELRAELVTGAPLWIWAIVLGVPALLALLAFRSMRRGRRGPRATPGRVGSRE